MSVDVVVMKGYDVIAATERTLYYSSEKFNTIGTDTPAHTHFVPRLVQPVSVRRSMFAPGTTRGRSTVSIGEAKLGNIDGALDGVADYAFDGRDFTAYRGERGAAFPDGYVVVWTGKMRGVDHDGDDLVVRLRDEQTALDGLIQSTHFDGDNVLPAGLEGGADIEGEPKPFALGVVRNATPPMVNSAKLIYQVNDGAVDSVDMVFDAGVPIVPQGSFSSRTIPSGFDGTPFCGAWSDSQGLFVVFSNGGSADECVTSPDGITWTNRTIASQTWWDVAYSPALDLWCAVGGSAGPVIYTSPDGITWTSRTSTHPGNSLRGVAWGGGYFVAVGDSGDIERSTDGVTWSAATTDPGGALIFNDVIYAFGNWYACTDTEEVYYSTDDGDTWTLLYDPSPGSNASKAMAFGGGRLVVASNNGVIATCVDGLTFEARSVIGITGQITDIDYGFGYFLLTGPNGLYATSPDGINWSSFVMADTSTINGVVFGSTDYGTWVALQGGTPDRILSSTGAGSDYSSEAELLDDTLQPLPGQFKAYPAGGYIRLGSSPSGVVTADFTVEATAAERTAAQLWVKTLEKFGKSNMVNIQTTTDLDTWTKILTVSVTSGVDDPVGGAGAFTIYDADPTNLTRINLQAQNFTGDGVKVVELVIREYDHPATGIAEFFILDTDDSNATRFRCEVDSWAGGQPSASMATGTLIDMRYVGNGYWRILAYTESVTAANDHTYFIEPASTPSETGRVDVYRWNVYDESTFFEAWNWLDVERADNDNAGVCGYWTGLEYVSASTVLSALAGSIGAWWGVDRFGVLRLQVVEDPALSSNGFTFSRELDNAAWTKVATSITADDRIAPDGQSTMDKIVEAVSSGGHYLARSFPTTGLVQGGNVTLSFFAAADERDHLLLWVNGFTGNRRVSINLADGTLATSQPSSTMPVSIVDVGGGVYHISTVAPLGVGASAPSLFIMLLDGPAWNSDDDYVGDGSSGLHVWGISTPKDIALEITESGVNPIAGELVRLPSVVPPTRHHVRYQRNHTVQATAGLAAGVLDSRREVVAREFQEVEAVDAAVATRHLLATDRVVETYLDARADASTEATRLQELAGVMRHTYAFGIELNAESAVVDLGSLVRVVHSRYGLAAGKTLIVRDVKPDAAANRLELEAWG